jgi:UDP:flavonoid glycosyltransferase YjiC (YdhE family)/glycosyltransferase involved in cell wall biosynthesis
MTATTYDVAILCDFRYPGGTSASIAQEVLAQARAGLSTVLVHVPSPHQPGVHPFSPRISDLLRDGLADLVHDGTPVQAKLLVIRQPRIFTRDLDRVPRITADRTVLVINQPPGDTEDPNRYYDIPQVRARVEGYFGTDVVWSPISPQVREHIGLVAPTQPLSAQDWHEIIDVADWWFDRPGPVADIPVIGRHGRDDKVKWPREAAEILAAYPDTGDVRVRVLGGGAIAVKRIGHKPESWDLIPFGAEKPDEFLRTIDFFVYFHDPSWAEAFGRTILEAAASGVPVIIAEHFRPIFGDAALYSTPEGSQALVRSLYDDWGRYSEVCARARRLVEAQFDHRTHLSRLAALGVRPSVTLPAPRRPAGPVPAADGRKQPDRVLMVSDNGAGLGHLSRLMAIARRLPDGVEAVIATQSYGAALAYQEGFLTEYIPSRKALGRAKPRWNTFIRERLRHLIELHRPSVVAVDSVPHEGIVAAVADHPGITWIWVRRAMWQRGVGEIGAGWIEQGRAFDAVLEPGEFAAAADEGPTVAHRAEARLVEPITFLDADELVDAATARRALGLTTGSPSVLLQLGAGTINDIASPVARIARFLGDAGFQVVLAESAIATEPMPPVLGAHIVRVYPVSRFLRGFDLVVAASGYNSFHELLGFGVPTVFVPNTETQLDDQVARARFAAAAGVSLIIEDPSSDEVERVLAQAVRADVRDALSRRCAEVGFGNGAGAAAEWIGALCTRAVQVGG